MSAGKELLKEITNLALLAVGYDEQKDLEAAIYYYEEVVRSLESYLADAGNVVSNSFGDLKTKLTNYQERAQILRDKLEHGNDEKTSPKEQSESSRNIQHLEFLLNQALDEDEQDNLDEALENYMEAVETGLSIKSSITDETQKKRLTALITKALERAEWIKKSKTEKSNDSLEVKLSNLSVDKESPVSTSLPPKSDSIVPGPQTYTRQEILVLKESSYINGVEYLPFLDKFDLAEKFFSILPYCDPLGMLKISPKEKEKFRTFKRISDLSSSPCLIDKIDCFAIKQTNVTDCSFIASLIVSALYESRYSKKLITSIIYPQNSKMVPVYNPCGKYMIKLNLNGIWRKIVIDDFLPVGKHGELLCSYSSNRDEFWVSLLEKAYMKVMGGYDFPGSNSNIDLHALTGWIPERIVLEDAGKDKLYKLLMDRFSKGSMLVTFATMDMSDTECNRTGLVSSHAYAMLHVTHFKGSRLFLLKNPWSHMRWKGRFSERDIDNWTPELQQALKFDPKSAKNFDNGVFWIDIDSLFHFFDVCYINWDPSIFGYTYCTHDRWNAGVGPARDLYCIGDNPQYELIVSNNPSSVWIHLTRHIMDRNDFANNREYIAVVVYKNNGEKVYIPGKPEPYIDAARINSPHFLCKIIVNKENPVKKYTLVVSQYEKTTTIHYTLRAYSTSPFVLRKIEDRLKYRQEDKNGQWTRETAGGCPNHRDTFDLNPVYSLTLEGDAREHLNELLIEMRAPKDFQIGVTIKPVTLVNANSPNAFKLRDSGSYRSGYTYLKISPVPVGTYHLIPATFHPQQIGPFFIRVRSSHPIRFGRIR